MIIGVFGLNLIIPSLEYSYDWNNKLEQEYFLSELLFKYVIRQVSLK